jgi:hypothetical protein
MAGLVIFRSAERPDLRLWLQDDTGALINFASGYSFTFKLGAAGAAASFTKTSGITGAAGVGTAPTGTPNVVISFIAGETDTLAKGSIRWELKATTGGLDRYFEGTLTVRDVSS